MNVLSLEECRIEGKRKERWKIYILTEGGAKLTIAGRNLGITLRRQ